MRDSMLRPAPTESRAAALRPTSRAAGRRVDAAQPIGAVEMSMSGRRVQRWPVTDQGCFGWLHVPADQAAMGTTAVLICPALVWDALQTHHSMRLLANECAAAGYPAMRFDYPGTGNSADLSADSAQDTWAIWLDSVHRAADRLKSETGARRIVFCGLRAGATLAMLAAVDRADAAGALLVAPVLRGRSYIQQLRVQAQLEGSANDAEPGGLGFHELAFSARTVAAIAAVDLRTALPQAGLSIGVFPQAPSNLVSGCLAAWQASGASVTCGDYAGLEPVLRMDVQGEAPAPDFHHVLAWLRTALPHQQSASPRPVPSVARLVLPGCSETPMRFGDRMRLFGIICSPTTAAPDARPGADLAVVIVNTGRDPLSGIGRFGVELARGLAARGITSLRMDFSGLGDSTGQAGCEHRLGALFEDARTADVGAALDLLQARGFARFVLHGLCSGAYHAFHAGVADRRVTGLMLVNLPVFVWNPGEDVRFVAHTQTSPASYLGRLVRWDTWSRLLRGKVDVLRLLRAQWRRQLRGADAAVRDAASRKVAALSRRHCRTLFVFSPDDPGLDAMRQAFGPECAGLAAAPACSMELMQGLDHVLSGRAMRAKVAERCAEFVADVPTGIFLSGNENAMRAGSYDA